MSGKFSKLQKKIIAHLENALSNTDTKPNVVKKISKDSHQDSTIYKSIMRLEIRKVLVPSKTRNLFSSGYIVRPQQIPNTVTLDKESEDYIEYKEKFERK